MNTQSKEVPQQSVPYSPEDVLSAQAVCAWLRPGVPLDEAIKWLAEKTRFRCSNPLPVKNIGRCLIYSKLEVTRWLQSLERSPRAYPKRTREQMVARAASARAAKAARKAAA